MDPIIWDSSIQTGHRVVDLQHQAIFKAFNRLLKAMQQGKGRDEVHRTLVFLQDYTQRHFSMEEELMDQSDYPDMSQHCTLHHEFIEKVVRLTDRSERGATVTIAVMQFLKDWLVDHVKVEDMRLTRHLAQWEARARD